MKGDKVILTETVLRRLATDEEQVDFATVASATGMTSASAA